MSVVQWKAIYDRLAALEAKVADLERLRYDPDEVADGFRDSIMVTIPSDVEYTLPPSQTPDQFIATIKRRPGRPRKVTNGQS